MGEQGRRVAQGRWQAGGQGAAYGVRGGPAFQPGGDGRGEALDVPYGEQQSGIVPPEVREQGGGRGVVCVGTGPGR
ncbi:hypothetical protein [Streptomyces sp. C10]|uniref:hypothetical protein n=1 Tax=Streptomyces sp. C10 TaxID=531941 RepID=UPI00397ED460